MRNTNRISSRSERPFMYLLIAFIMLCLLLYSLIHISAGGSTYDTKDDIKNLHLELETLIKNLIHSRIKPLEQKLIELYDNTNNNNDLNTITSHVQSRFKNDNKYP